MSLPKSEKSKRHLQIMDTSVKNSLKKLKSKSDVKVYVAMGKIKHDKTVSTLKRDKNRKPEVHEDINTGNFKTRFTRRMQSRDGHDFYKLRKHTVEPVFGIIKHVLGFRQFLTRGLDDVKTEWDWITLAYNFKRIHKLMALKKLKKNRVSII